MTFNLEKYQEAVGTYQHLDPSVEERACNKCLGLKANGF